MYVSDLAIPLRNKFLKQVTDYIVTEDFNMPHIYSTLHIVSMNNFKIPGISQANASEFLENLEEMFPRY